jgi:hypothetical protein
MKKCPPGVICIENFTIFIFIILLVGIAYFFFKNQNQNQGQNPNLKQNINIYDSERTGSSPSFGFGFLPSYPYNNLPVNDVLLNPYAAPLRDERYFVPELMVAPRNAVPINISTTAVDTTYRQLGILTPLNGSSKDNILPLMGRPLFTRRSLWQYYTISNQHNNVKLPVSVKGKSGLNDNGVDEIYSGDTVYVEGYNEPFKVTKYENDTIKYLPFI